MIERIGRTIERLMTMATTTLISRPSKVTQTTTCWLRCASKDSWLCRAVALATIACVILRRSMSTASKLSSVWPIIIVAMGASVRPTSMVSRACALQLLPFRHQVLECWPLVVGQVGSLDERRRCVRRCVELAVDFVLPAA